MRKFLAGVLALGVVLGGVGVARASGDWVAHAQVIPVLARNVADGTTVADVHEGRQGLPVPCCEEVRSVGHWQGASPFAIGLRVLGGGVDGGYGGVDEHFRLVDADGGTIYSLLEADSSVGCAPDGTARSDTGAVRVQTGAGYRWVDGTRPELTTGVPVDAATVADFELVRITGAAQVEEFTGAWAADVAAGSGWVLDARLRDSATGAETAHHRFLVAAGYCSARSGPAAGTGR
ncbi:hypothetical protein [Umezawaea sp. Da 62-37]|uniref:hypothetical protein n=1 Tax=Umezawaea sp. Da 62-37 TaxID=3075927 RepID=UPI0028F724F7|nr:hypothetical protein [Umezawaea sp. Da 62-37]WNV91156.1 hypothetical protein RM788_23630 [Umezawaea sp. Da 62-37]